MIDLSQASFVGPKYDDDRTLAIPPDMRDLLRLANGFILFGGGLHLRGVCEISDWHSLLRVWTGEDALGNLYPSVHPDDIPFGENSLGDQFLLRAGSVMRLFGETGEIESVGLDLHGFLDLVSENSGELLSLSLLRQFESEYGPLEPGRLLSVYPPLCTREAAAGVSLRAIPTLERIRFLADFASQISSVRDDTTVQFNVRPPTH